MKKRHRRYGEICVIMYGVTAWREKRARVIIIIISGNVNLHLGSSIVIVHVISFCAGAGGINNINNKQSIGILVGW